jgi:phosphate transport system substrate-binding protein
MRPPGYALSLLIAVLLVALGGPLGAEQIGNARVDPGITSYAGPASLKGSLVIAGSDTMYPLMVKLVSSFQQFHRSAKLGVEGGGTEKALMKFISDQSGIRRGDADVGAHQVSGSVGLMASSRPLTREERDDFRTRYGFEVTEVPIAMDAVALYVNKANPIQGLTLEQVDAIFGAERKRGVSDDISTWGQVGLKDEWERESIHLYGRGKDSGTRTFFIHTALLGGNLKSSITEEPGSASEILAISRDTLALGYAGIGFQTSFVRPVPLAEKTGMPYVPPSAEAAAQGSYPLGRPLYLYAKKDPSRELEPVILEFLKFVNSWEGQLTVAKSGLYPLPATQVAKNLRTLTGSDPSSAVLSSPKK